MYVTISPWQASPRLGFNKDGSLLAVTTSDNGIKILANADGQRVIRMLESRAFEGSRNASQQAIANVKVIFRPTTSLTEYCVSNSCVASAYC